VNSNVNIQAYWPCILGVTRTISCFSISTRSIHWLAEYAWNGKPKRVIVPYSEKLCILLNCLLSTTRHEKSDGKSGRLRSKPKYWYWPIVNKYREGKVKSTPEGGWNSFWNHILTKSGSLKVLIYQDPGDRVPIEEWSNELHVRCLLNRYKREGLVKARMNSPY
jgi:hypothetical protein